MKAMKRYEEVQDEIYPYVDDNDERSGKKKTHLVPENERRPTRNWTKIWLDHSTNYDEVDAFYAKN